MIGAFGLPAYAFKGIHEEIQRKKGFNVDHTIIDVLLAQGEQEWNDISAENKRIILRRWEGIIADRQNQGKFQYQ